MAREFGPTGGGGSTTDEEDDSTDKSSTSSGGDRQAVQDEVTNVESMVSSGGSGSTSSSGGSTSTSSGTSSRDSGAGSRSDLQGEIAKNEQKAKSTESGSGTQDQFFAEREAPDTSTPSGGSPDQGGRARAPTDNQESDTGAPDTSTPSGGSPDQGGPAQAPGSSSSPSTKRRRRREKATGSASGAVGGAGAGFEQGVESDSGRVARQARALEAELVSQYTGLGPQDVAIRRQGDRLVADLDPRARERVVRESLNSPGTRNKAAAVGEARRTDAAVGAQELNEEFVFGAREAVEEQQSREAAGDFWVPGSSPDGAGGNAAGAAEQVRAGESRNAFSRSRTPRQMRLATAIAMDQAVAKANSEYRTAREQAYESAAEAEQGEVYDVDWSFGFGDPDRDEVEQFLREGARRWERDSIGFLEYRTNTSVQDIRQGFSEELQGSRAASEAAASDRGVTNAEYGQSQLLAMGTSGRPQPSYTSRTNVATLGVLPSTVPFNVPRAAQGGLELAEAGVGTTAVRKQSQREAAEKIVSASPGSITENPERYRDLVIQAATGLPTTKTESATQLRRGGQYTAGVATAAAGYAARNPNKAILGGAAVAGQAYLGGAALARAPGAVSKVANAVPSKRIREFPYGGGVDRGMAKLTGPDGDSETVLITAEDLNNRGFGMPDNPTPKYDRGLRVSRQGSGNRVEPSGGGEPTGMGYRSSQTELGTNYLDAQRVARMDFDEFAGTNRAAGTAVGAASGSARVVTSGTRRRLEDAQAPQVTLDDAVSGSEEDLTAAGAYSGTLAGGMQLYREEPATVEDTTQLFSDRASQEIEPATAQPSAEDSVTGIETNLSVAQSSIGGQRPTSGNRVNVGVTPQTGLGVEQPQAQAQPQVQEPTATVFSSTPFRNPTGPSVPMLRRPFSPRRTPDPDLEEEPPRTRSDESNAGLPAFGFGRGGPSVNWFNETIVAAATQSRRAREPASESSGNPVTVGLFGQRPTEVEVSGDAETQADIEATRDLFAGFTASDDEDEDSLLGGSLDVSLGGVDL